MPSWLDSLSPDRSSRQQSFSSGSRHYGAPAGTFGEDYGSSRRTNRESGYSSRGSGGYEGGESIRRAATTRETHQYRDVSPPRSERERPRNAYGARFDPSEHRSVSPLGSSWFEQPFQSSRRRYDSSSLGRSATVREAREIPRYGYDGYFGSSDTTDRTYGTGAGISRSNAIRGRANDRGFGVTGFAGGASDLRYQETRRQQRHGSNFGSGGFSSWENY
ncbi:hypothetical protein EK21DRAFT_89409 [Setomelanomma holmii]|uniref:Uncharacterized protein n=1 Tax=Setomelanomma holmii TaxID=210430 RepID=A0A9P4H946_9PLEO|nr:hypothetical protein EK21DRAFT_89409 [Setomelanomma holmii]